MSTALLSFVAVRKSFWRGVREVVVLDDASLSLYPGDFACVVGERAAGKTTLLEIAAGLRAPDAGHVFYRERDMAALGDRALTRLRRSEIACVWNRATPTIHAASVLDHVALPLVSAGIGRTARRHAAADVLERVGAGEYAHAGLDGLSDAERARVALAQAAVRRPRLLILDEITDTLDLLERNTLLGALQSFAHDDGCAILLSAADGHGAAGSNKLYSLSDGRLVGGSEPSLGDVVQLRPPAPREHGQSG